jgi:hypothetical protein
LNTVPGALSPTAPLIPEETTLEETNYVEVKNWFSPFQKEPIPTDSKGRAKIMTVAYVPGVIADRQTQFELWIEATGYGPRDIMWLCQTGHVMAMVTNDYTVRLSKGIQIGGTIVDEANKPMAGIKVGASGNNCRGYSVSYSDGVLVSPVAKRVEDFACYNRSIENTKGPVTVTDQEGRFMFSDFPSDLRALVLELAEPGGATHKVRTF